MDKLDFIAIGDITTDAFIRLKDAKVHCNIDNTKCELCVRFGDKIPYEFVEVVKAVGNSPNASVSASRLGLKSGLVTNIGDDDAGKEAVECLKSEKVNTDFIDTHNGIKTNYHFVLWYEAERTILVKHEEYPYKWPENLPKSKWIYLSSLGENSAEYHEAVANYAKNNPEVNLAFQPGTYQIKAGYEKMKSLYEVSALFFCNVQEAQKILGNDTSDVKELLKGMHNKGPKTVCITDGPRGAYAYDGTNMYFHVPYPDPKPPLDRTGAGDSFSSTFTCALALGKTLPEAMSWGPINSMSVVQGIGAQKGLLTRERLEEFLANAPENYKAEKIN